MRKLYLILLLPIFWLTSCNDFLDVSADNELLQKEIFGDYKGVRMAVKIRIDYIPLMRILQK